MPDPGNANPGGRAFPQHVPAETKQLSRPSACLLIEAGGALYQSAIFNKTAEILFVQPDPREGFHDPLELKQRER